MLVNYNGVETLYYGYADNQGSLIALTNESGAVVEKYAYNPWGARRDPANWQLKDTRTSFITNRGYTGHEHMDAFGIINMNGRVYDPLTAMFFSPDPFVQAPGNWLNYNRYGYCMNNPTNYTDPTGYQRMYIDMPAFSEYASHWGEYATSGASDWSHKDRGPIRYDFDDHKYQYANGDEATEQEAMDMYAKPSNSHTYYGQNASTVFTSLRDGDSYTTNALNNIGNSVKAHIAENKVNVNNWASLSLALVALDVSTPDPSDLVWQKRVLEGVVVGAAVTYLYSGNLIEKMQREINGISQRIAGPPGIQYALVASKSGDYPNVRGGTPVLPDMSFNK